MIIITVTVCYRSFSLRLSSGEHRRADGPGELRGRQAHGRQVRSVDVAPGESQKSRILDAVDRHQHHQTLRVLRTAELQRHAHRGHEGRKYIRSVRVVERFHAESTGKRQPPQFNKFLLTLSLSARITKKLISRFVTLTN